jgi:DNA-binding response OmpR family regulator
VTKNGKEPASRPRKGLIVDDDVNIASLLSLFFTQHGIRVDIMGNGAEAIVRLKDRSAEYGLVCSDVELPGASGWMILEWVRGHAPDLPVMLISGMDDEDFLHKANGLGAVAAFRKPFNILDVRKTLAMIFP